MRYFLHLAYNGSLYRGWQRQLTANSIQATIEDTISKMLHEKHYIHGCGRTDAEVHASQFFAHIDIDQEISFDILSRLNKMLPNDISIIELIPVHGTAHAQYDANLRTYSYYFHLKKDALISSTSAYYDVENFDVSEFKKGLNVIKNTTDFRTLCKTPDIYKHTNCNVHQLLLSSSTDKQNYRLDITANRFLRGMIRYMMGRLIDVGSAKLSIDHFQELISSKKPLPTPYHLKGYPQGLYLSKIEYDYLSRPMRQTPLI